LKEMTKLFGRCLSADGRPRFYSCSPCEIFWYYWQIIPRIINIRDYNSRLQEYMAGTYWENGVTVRFLTGRGVFIFSVTSRPVLGPNQPPVQGTLWKVVFPTEGTFAGA
jgi:hypothetical protein